MKVYNTLTRQKEEFIPMEEGKVKMYVCGPTVYDYIHIGNARPYVVFDTVRRYMEYKGYEVKYVQNFTDVDDKIINRANKEGVTMQEISNKYIEEAFHDADGLNVKRATVHPRVTEEMDGIIAMVQTLIDKGFAYEDNGTVYYDTKKFPEYGKLSRKNLDELIAGASKEFALKIQDMLDHLCGVLGVAEVVEEAVSDEDVAKIEALIAERTEAKKTKDFARADAIRDELAAMGITIKDTRQGVQWSRG